VSRYAHAEDVALHPDRLNKSNRLLLELKRVPNLLTIGHLRFPFAIKATR
jgi:hypothetical protein